MKDEIKEKDGNKIKDDGDKENPNQKQNLKNQRTILPTGTKQSK